jgi:hypothetical protein
MENMGEYRDMLKNKGIFLVVVIWEKCLQFKVLKRSKRRVLCNVPVSFCSYELKSEQFVWYFTAVNMREVP